MQIQFATNQLTALYTTGRANDGIPATMTDHFLGKYDQRSKRELAANTFLGYLDQAKIRPDDQCPAFKKGK